MDKNQMIAKTVEMTLAQTAKNLAETRSSITGSFELGYDIESSTMERLAEYQHSFKLWTTMSKVVARGVEKGDLAERLGDKLEDLHEGLLSEGAGGSTSQISNGITEAKRKVDLRCYRTLSSLLKG